MANVPAHSSPFASRPPASKKVAIPRLQRPSYAQHTSKERRRVPRACTSCRTHKIKCTGETPQCKHCATTNRECVYVMPRRDRLKNVTEQCVQMAAVLNELRDRVNEDDSARIAEVLDGVEETISATRQTPVPSNPDSEADGLKGIGDAANHDSTMLDHDDVDTGSLDMLDENLQKDDQARATGFIGQNSVLQWLRTVAALLADRPQDESAALPERRGSQGASVERVSSFTFWMDDENAHLDFYIDPYEFPDSETAGRLLSCYLSKVHDSFPILPQKLFKDQFHKFFTALQQGNAPRVSPKWQAIINLVFAIGAKYSHLVQAKWRADERDHLIYQARARTLAVNEYALTELPDVPQIQVLGLVAFYWFSTGQISRAWTTIGTAVRCAYSLGLHVRNEDPSASAAKRETLVRVWWSLYSLERTLSVVTGRPSLIVDACCSVPLPIPVPESQITDEVEAKFRMRKQSLTPHSSSSVAIIPLKSLPGASPRIPVGLGAADANSGSYFKATIQLNIITQDILTSLYSAGTLIRPLSVIQQDLAQLNLRLDQWSLSLPAEFNFENQLTPSIVFTRERTILGFQLCSAKILLSRPCLGTLGRAGKEINDAGLTKRMANICIEAAQSMINFLPDEPSPLFLYDQGPWWAVVHHMMQAYCVFLLVLLYGSPISQDNYTLVQYVKKIIRWLRAMREPVAERAYRISLTCFDGVAKQLSVDTSDLWIENSMAEASRNNPHSDFDTDLGGHMSMPLGTTSYPDPSMIGSAYAV